MLSCDRRRGRHRRAELSCWRCHGRILRQRRRRDDRRALRYKPWLRLSGGCAMRHMRRQGCGALVARVWSLFAGHRKCSRGGLCGLGLGAAGGHQLSNERIGRCETNGWTARNSSGRLLQYGERRALSGGNSATLSLGAASPRLWAGISGAAI
eukprot:scaffold33229_cov112-Isochrysis_galbana.AAC.3